MCEMGQWQRQCSPRHVWGAVSLSTRPDAPRLLAVASRLTLRPSPEDSRGRRHGPSAAWTHLLMQAPRAWRVFISLCSFFSSPSMAPLERVP